jgi:carboxylesterase type B
LPYAEPPIGERRFLRPEPIMPLDANKVLDVSNTSYIHCMQPDVPPNVPGEGTEDCLYLWVYSPSICKKDIKGA